MLQTWNRPSSRRTASLRALASLVVLIAPAIPAALCQAQPMTMASGKRVNPIVEAMQSEMKRSMEQLRLKNSEAPYFIQYTIRDRSTFEGEATFGALVRAGGYVERTLGVDLRIGSYDLDNSGFLNMNEIFTSGENGYHIVMGLDDDAIRHELWLATDAAYKRAVEQFARKKAAMTNKVQEECLPDFSDPPEPPSVDPDSFRGMGLPAPDSSTLVEMIREGSAVFRNYPGIQESSVHVRSEGTTTYIITSEGAGTIQPNTMLTFEVRASAEAADGMRLNIFRAFSSTSGSSPGSAERQGLLDSIRMMAAELTALAAAKPLEKNYDGPVLFTGEAAAEVFAQVLAPHLSGQRPPIADQGPALSMAGITPSELTEKMNRPVLPRFLSVVDDPTISQAAGAPLIGSYAYDDQGVPARKIQVVENGVLKNLLMTRKPNREQNRSNGHARMMGPNNINASISNLIVEANNGRSDQELKNELMKMCRDMQLPYGILVRSVQVPGTSPREGTSFMIFGDEDGGGSGKRRDLASPIVAYKVHADDGREELVRGMTFGEFSVRTLRGIIAAGNTPYVHNRFMECQGVLCDQMIPVSIVAPSILFEELEVERESGSQQRPALISHPFFSGD